MDRSRLRVFEVPWLTDTDMERILLFRGTFVSAAAQVETILTELAVRASYHPNYVDAREHFPRRRDDRIKHLRKLCILPGPLAPRAKRLDAIVQFYEASQTMRDRLAHARMTARSDGGMIARAFGLTEAVRLLEIAGGGDLVELRDNRMSINELRQLAERAALVSRATERYYAWAGSVLPSITERPRQPATMIRQERGRRCD